MTNKNKAAGTRFETDVVNYLRVQGFEAERLTLHSAEDEGDVVLRVGPCSSPAADRFIIECKREKGFHLADWVKQAKVESLNYRAHRNLNQYPGFLVVHYARGKGLAESYVTTTLSEWLRHV